MNCKTRAPKKVGKLTNTFFSFQSVASSNIDFKLEGARELLEAAGATRQGSRVLLERYDEGDAGGEEGGGRPPRSSVSLKSHAYCMCDDDNDIEMAVACRAAYLPSVTSESMRALATNDDDDDNGDYSLVVVEDAPRGIIESLATEAALEAIIERVSSDHDRR